MKNKKEYIIPDDFCPHCGSLEVKKTSDGVILCKNCGAVSKVDWDNNELTIKMKIKDLK